MHDDPPPDHVRSAGNVARRAVVLFAVVGLAFGAERKAVLDWLTENDLWAELAPSEASFVDTPHPSRQQIIDAGWLSERLIVLLWALGAVEQLPPADEQCDTAVFQKILPPFAEVDVKAFIARSTLRPDAELIAMADEMRDLHWEARDARSKARPLRTPVDMGIIQERHHAINWVIGYYRLPWDEVTTDT